MAGSGLILRKGFVNAVCFQCRNYFKYPHFIFRDDKKIFQTGFGSRRTVCHTPALCCNSKEAKLEFRPLTQPQLIRRGCNLTLDDVSQKVKLSGWLQHKRHNGLFLILRDREDLVQIVVNDPLMVLSLRDLPVESVIEVIGTVQRRPKSKENEDMTTGSIEVIAEEIKILNRCNSNMPFKIHEFHEVREPLRLQYRYLDLRQPKLQRNLKLRSDLLFRMQEYFYANDFRYVETPTLFRKTPGGAREFIVPTHDRGMVYTLPQSPQQFKQLLMVGAIERYVQVARCFRDETARPDRQPEFTQIDLEMSFIDQEDIKYITEGMIIHSWPEHLRSLQTPFPRMDFRDAIRTYGSDKPDTRFDCLLQEVTDVFQFCQFPKLKNSFENRPDCSIQAVKFPHVSNLNHFDLKSSSHPPQQLQPYVSKKDIKTMEQLLESSFPQKSRAFFSVVRIEEDGSWSGNLRELIGEVAYKRLSDRLQLRPGDVFILCSGLDRNSCLTAGKFRVEMASLLKGKGFSVYKKDNMMNFLWVENFPLFLPKEDGTEGLESAHHPFTAPHPDDEQLLYSNPEKVRGQHYDLVLNGVEVAGGSIRIHDAKLQRYVLQEILKEDSSPLEHLIEALDCGCPPHGGIALGFDRYVSILCNARSIRDVIAFPKSSEGKCLMSKAPSPITQEDKDYYHIDIKK